MDTVSDERRSPFEECANEVYGVYVATDELSGPLVLTSCVRLAGGLCLHALPLMPVDAPDRATGIARFVPSQSAYRTNHHNAP
jgi:hypothetical protein